MQPHPLARDDPAQAGGHATNLVLVGLPGAGKSSVGKRLAQRMGLPFRDADTEIQRAAGMTIAEIFARHGEASFRAGEARVIARLLQEGPAVIATGGGAYMSDETRANVAEKAVSIWLDASDDVLLTRIAKRTHRPLFHNVDPAQKLADLRGARDPFFATADIRVVSSNEPHERVVQAILSALRERGMAAP